MPLAIKAKPKPVLHAPAKSHHPETTGSKPAQLFAGVLNRSTVNRHRLGAYTKDDFNIHVSDLMQSSKERMFCAREQAINFHEKRGGEMIRRLTPAMSLLHSMGHAVQDHLTTKFIRESPHGHSLWGDWTCPCRNKYVKQSLRPDFCCEVCQQPVSIYQETTLRQQRYHLVGHPDILILWNGYLHIYEVKSIDRASLPFDDINEPLGDHVLQGSFYYWIALDMHQKGLLPYPPHDHINYLYVDRSNTKLFFGEPYKEFEKQRSRAERLKPMLDRADVLIKSLQGNNLPARICKEVECTRAKNCSVQVSCFNRTSNTLETSNVRTRPRLKSA